MATYAASASTPVFTASPPAGALATDLWLPPARFQVYARWEEFAQDKLQETLITKQVQVRLRRTGAGQAAWLHTTEPQLRRTDAIQPVEQLALRVAALYEHVVLGVASNGGLTHLLNYPQLCQTWDALKATLLAEAAAEDQLTRKLVELVEKEVAHEEKMLHSLRHDYLYQVLGQVLSTAGTGPRNAGAASREFSNFFPHLNLWFREETEAFPAEGQQRRFALRGVLDEAQTDVGAIHRLMRKALALPDATPAAVPTAPVPHFGYEADYVLNQATGTLAGLTLTVYARLGLLYNK